MQHGPTYQKITYLRIVIAIRTWIVRFHEFNWGWLHLLNMPYPFWQHPSEFDPRKKPEFLSHRAQKNRLQMNILLAKSALEYVKSLKISSSNLPESSNNNRSYAREYLLSMRDIRKLDNLSDLKDDEYWFNMGIVAARSQIGNCGELSANAYQFLKKICQQRKVDFCCTQNGGHAFIVIGRQDNSDSDYHTWGNTAVVCDLWTETVFPVFEIESQLKDWDPYTKKIKNFDHRTQSICFEKQDRIQLPYLKDLENHIQNLYPQHQPDAYRCLTFLQSFYNKNKSALAEAKTICDQHSGQELFDSIKQKILDYEQHKMKK